MLTKEVNTSIAAVPDRQLPTDSTSTDITVILASMTKALANLDDMSSDQRSAISQIPFDLVNVASARDLDHPMVKQFVTDFLVIGIL